MADACARCTVTPRCAVRSDGCAVQRWRGCTAVERSRLRFHVRLPGNAPCWECYGYSRGTCPWLYVRGFMEEMLSSGSCRRQRPIRFVSVDGLL